MSNKRSIYENQDGSENGSVPGLAIFLSINTILCFFALIYSIKRTSTKIHIIYIILLLIFTIIQCSLIKMLWDNDNIFNKNLMEKKINEKESKINKKKAFGIAFLVFIIVNLILIIIHIIFIFTYKPHSKIYNVNDENEKNKI